MIDIVTINFNNKNGLEKTIASVINQTYFDKINYIIIDGDSTDGSKEVIEEYKDKLFYWVSEPDKGIFNAMNKAIGHLNGDYVLFLNSGDFLRQNDIIELVYDKLDADICYGNEYFFRGINALVNYTSLGNGWTSTYPDALDENFFKRSALPHQSTFISVKYHKQHPYREDCVIAGDWTFFREAIMKYGATYKHLPITISNYGTDGISAKKFHVFQHEKNEYYKKLDK